MSSIFGNNIKLSIFGESHGKAIGGIIDGIEPGLLIDLELLQQFLDRRRPGRSKYSSQRSETDIPVFLSGLVDQKTTASPLAFILENKGQRSSDYDHLKAVLRPGHADYTAHIKYQGYEDKRGGGHFSGRLTAPICVGGGILIQALAKRDISISSHIVSIKGNKADPYSEIEKAREQGDSVGGIVGCTIKGVVAGLGGPKMASIEARLAANVFGAIGATKGIEFGTGFGASLLLGSENNDPYHVVDGQIYLKSNHSGGVLGGISTGQDIVFRIAIKPTPSIAKSQQTVDIERMENTELAIEGRHDPSIVPRVLPVVEAVAAFTIYDILKD